MLGYAMVGTNDLDRATEFYDAVLKTLDLMPVEQSGTYTAYAPISANEAVEFYVTTPFDTRAASAGNGTMIALQAPSLQTLGLFHQTGLQNGGIDEGAPGPREAGSNICYAYIRDLDGNKICAYCNEMNV